MDRQLKETEVKADKVYKQMDTAEKIEKHKALLRGCSYYISIIEQNTLNQMLYDEARKFSNDTYTELRKDDFVIAAANTCKGNRYVDPVTDLKLDLEALHKMLVALLVKEGADIKNDINPIHPI